MSNPKDKKLYDKIKKKIYEDIPKHSLYRSAIIQKEYKKQGGEYIKKKSNNENMNIKKWFKQDWLSINDYVRGKKNIECGNNNASKYSEYPLCRPRSIIELLNIDQLKKMINEKNKLKNKPLKTEKILNTKKYNIKSTNKGI